MKMGNLRRVTTGLVVAVAATGSSAHATTATGQFQVTLTIQAECRLTSATDLAFGTTGVIQSAINSTSTIGVQCTNSTPYNVGINAGTGSGATVASRIMSSGAGAGVTYQLYRDSARTQLWGNTVNTDTVSATGTGAVQSLTVYGRVPAQNTPAAGNYSDTVQVTVTY